jgi:MurNAc alpha-1-phosphate uridylyltransferase
MACASMRGMILAAGRGERMGPLTAETPKPLLDLAGQSLLERQLQRLAVAGVHEVVINLSYRGDQIRQAIGSGERFGLSISYSQEPEVPLETAGGIVAALPRLGSEPFVVVNADVVSDFAYDTLVLDGGLGTLVLVPNPGHNSAGDYGIDAGSRLTKGEPRFTFSGISLLSPALFATLAPGRRPLSEVFDSAIRERQLRGVVHEGLWFDVGTPERLAAAERALAGKR